MKKILLLGGSTQQILAIEYAKKQGYGIILCDYLPDNPGQHYADRFYCVSTTDREAILEVAQKEKVDGVVAYASDSAAPTAAYVAEKMGLPTNPFKSVEILAREDLFRQFLKEKGFNCPLSDNFYDIGQAKLAIDRFTFPIMIKPVDLSGSKSVKCIESTDELEDVFNAAISISKTKNIIIEEFIEQDDKYLIGGDFFMLNGKVEFWDLHSTDKIASIANFNKFKFVLA